MIASRFLGYDQQDCQEFLRFFLDGLHEDLNKIIVKPPYQELKDIPDESSLDCSLRWWTYYSVRNQSVPKDLFCGQLRSTVVCKTCNKKSIAFDPFWDLSLPIPKAAQMREKKFGSFMKGAIGISTTKSSSVYECLKAFTEEEELAGDESCYCSRCKTHTISSKSISIFKLPQILVLHLKRFSYSTFRREKLSTQIEIPKTSLNMNEYCSPDASIEGSRTYDLIAVSNHHGGYGGGHYTAYVWNLSFDLRNIYTNLTCCNHRCSSYT